MKFRSLKFLWYRWRISTQARANAYHYLTGRGEQAVVALLGPPPALPADLVSDQPTTVDISAEQAELQASVASSRHFGGGRSCRCVSSVWDSSAGVRTRASSS
jgi:hypothetical protein